MCIIKFFSMAVIKFLYNKKWRLYLNLAYFLKRFYLKLTYFLFKFRVGGYERKSLFYPIRLFKIGVSKIYINNNYIKYNSFPNGKEEKLRFRKTLFLTYTINLKKKISFSNNKLQRFIGFTVGVLILFVFRECGGRA